MNPLSLFKEPIVQASRAIFARPGDGATLANWDALAAENPIHAAISQDDEKGEIKKGAREYARIVEEIRGGIVLDLGCGYGRLAKYVLRERVYEAYVGVDLSETMLAAFERRALSSPTETRTPLVLVKSPIERLPFKDDSVDAIVTSAVWLHNPKDVAAASIREALRVLKPGGKLLAFSSFVNARCPANWQDRLYSNLLPFIGRGRRNGPVRTYKEEEVRGLFSDFSDVRLEPIGCELLPARLLFLSPQLNLKTWKQLAVRVNRALAKTRFAMHPRLRTHIDVKVVK